MFYAGVALPIPGTCIWRQRRKQMQTLYLGSSTNRDFMPPIVLMSCWWWVAWQHCFYRHVRGPENLFCSALHSSETRAPRNSVHFLYPPEFGIFIWRHQRYLNVFFLNERNLNPFHVTMLWVRSSAWHFNIITDNLFINDKWDSESSN